MFYRISSNSKNWVAFEKKLRKKYIDKNKLQYHLTQSQSFQDIFAHQIQPLKGTYVELGSNHPIDFSNSYCLEKLFDWKGISLEIEKKYQWDWKTYRHNKLLIQDALSTNYVQCLEDNEITEIDYLSLDLSPNSATIQCLETLLGQGVLPKSISVEDDRFANKDSDKKIYDILINKGYKIAVQDVQSRDHITARQYVYENWYVRNDVSFVTQKYTDWINSIDQQFE